MPKSVVPSLEVRAIDSSSASVTVIAADAVRVRVSEEISAEPGAIPYTRPLLSLLSAVAIDVSEEVQFTIYAAVSTASFP
ncbi:MAG: hypothetical protein K6G50_01575 [bacterium]|nr:hypothetical protein [bacterium]